VTSTSLHRDAPAYAALGAVSSYLPKTVVSNDDLEAMFPDGNVARIADKTGIATRHVVTDETVTDLAAAAAETLFRDHGIDRSTIDFLLLCTQSPDFAMPTTSCLVHERLGLRADAAALDLGMGCSGYVYGLGVAKGLIESGQARNVVLVTADTLTRYINPADKQLRTIFGDGAAATLLTAAPDGPTIRGLAYGTDGGGARHLLVPAGGLADGASLSPEATAAARGIESNGYDMHMNGGEVFAFSLRAVPDTVRRSLASARLDIGEIDVFVLHQANAFMLETLRKKLRIPVERFVVEMAHCGNTTSSSIPIALEAALRSGQVRPGMRAMFVGFGVGLSWASVVVDV
jgi:3-oxoacyl-[acyl-carrier-protein] synthase-3